MTGNENDNGKKSVQKNNVFILKVKYPSPTFRNGYSMYKVYCAHWNISYLFLCHYHLTIILLVTTGYTV